MNYKKKRKLMKTLKREIKKVENIVKELNYKNYLIDKTKQL